MHINSPYPVITAEDAIKQGTSPWALMSAARFNDKLAEIEGETSSKYHRTCAQALRLVAAEVARRQGIQLYHRKKRFGVNDNRTRKQKWSSNMRRAA